MRARAITTVRLPSTSSSQTRRHLDLATDAVLDLLRRLGIDVERQPVPDQDIGPQQSTGEELRGALVRTATGNRGADVVIEMSGSYHALQEAVRTAAYSARVVAAGFFQGAGTPLVLGDEFHHNRITVVGSQISGVAPHLQHRWNELRMSDTVLALERAGKLHLEELITHVVKAEEAAAAFEMLDTAPEDALQVVLDYGVETAS